MLKAGLLSSRERVLLALQHRETDRIPLAMVCSGINKPARSAYDAYLQRECGCSLETYLDAILDIRSVDPRYIGPALMPDEDIWGVRRRPIQAGAGVYDEIAHYPLAGATTAGDIANHRWPSTAWFDYAVISERIQAANRDGDHCIMVANGNIFETTWYMRGFEQVFLDMLTAPELMHEIMERVTQFYLAHFSRILAAARGGVDLVFTADDIAGQRGLLMSPAMWETFIKPYHQRLNAVIHSYGAKVIYHTDGGMMEAAGGLVDMGIDVLQALQFDADGMDPAALKSQYGEKLCFQGGVSVQHTLPFGTPDDVRAEVEHLITVLGREGGYILGPSHAIQAGTPVANIHTLWETALTFYPF